MRKINRHNILLLILISITLLHAPDISAKGNLVHESEQLVVKLTPRTPQQMAAFYEARGFSKPMIDKIKQYCFITAFVKNKSTQVIQHDLSNWTFQQSGKALQRLKRQQLLTLWQEMHIPLAHQATFRWTLLPEQLDFLPNEREGGNIVLPGGDRPFDIEARFSSAEDEGAKPIIVNFNNIQCAKDPS